MMDSFRISFGPKSAMVKELEKVAIEKGTYDRLKEKLKNGAFVLEFVDDPKAKSITEFEHIDFSSERSEAYATLLIGLASADLRAGDIIPQRRATQLADALDRIWDNKNKKCKIQSASDFLYGPKKAGRQPNEVMRNFHIFITIEVLRSKLGSYYPGRKGDGAYAAAKEQLELDGSEVPEIDELHRMRGNIMRKARANVVFAKQLIHFIEISGYKARHYNQNR